MSAVRTASAIVAAVGFVTLAISFFLFQNRMQDIRKWKAVDAQVIRSWMEEKQRDEYTTYSANYELAYSVDGRRMRATARSDDSMVTKPELVQARLSRHSSGTHGVVFVNPDDPSQVHLNVGTNANTIGLPLSVLLAGVSLVLIGSSLWFIGTPRIVW